MSKWKIVGTVWEGFVVEVEAETEEGAEKEARQLIKMENPGMYVEVEEVEENDR